MRELNWSRIAIRLAVGFAILWVVWFAPVPFIDSWWRSANPDTGGLLNVRPRMAHWGCSATRHRTTSFVDKELRTS